ncbi:MAG TPA: hypothetical protein VIR01_08040 [Pyrinomonadaceae bacterium]|jgi:hypothetical protein
MKLDIEEILKAATAEEPSVQRDAVVQLAMFIGETLIFKRQPEVL